MGNSSIEILFQYRIFFWLKKLQLLYNFFYIFNSLIVFWYLIKRNNSRDKLIRVIYSKFDWMRTDAYTEKKW